MPIEQVRWGRGREKALIEQLDFELTDSLGVHQGLVTQWIKWLELYRAPVKQPVRNIPYEGAANFMLPVTATDADQLYAKFIQTLHAPDNLWTLKPLNERWTEANKPLQDFLTWMDYAILRMYNVNKRVVGEMVKLGTGIYKTGWRYERRPVWTYDNAGQVIKAERIKGAPFVDHVRLADFVFPPTAYAIDPDAQGGAQWVGERIRIHADKLRWLAESSEPFLPNIDKSALNTILHFEETGVTEYDAAVQRNDYAKTGRGTGLDFDTDSPPQHVSGGQPATTRYLKEIELWEIHARFPTDTGRSQDDLILWYHPPTRKIARAVYNYYHHGKRPYEVVRYFPGDGFYGIGVCEQKEVFQLMQSDLFNFNWDNVLLANSRMVVAKSGSNIAPGEPFYPNKVWIVDDDVNKSFGIFPMADVYPSLGQLQAMTQALGERRVGVSDIQLGQMQSLPGRTPATTMLSLMEEGARRPDLTLKDMRYEGLSAVGLRIIQVCQQFMGSVGQDVGGQRLLQIATDMLGTPEGQELAAKLTTPLENAEFGVGVAITATSGAQNKEVERQNYLSLIQLAGQLAPQFIQLAQVAMQGAGTPIGQTAMECSNGLYELLKRLLEQYDIRNVEAILPDPAAPPPVLPLGLPGGIPGVPGSVGPSGVNGGAVPAGPDAGAGGGAPVLQDLASLAALFSGVNSGL